ncbi:MAG: type II toxin-antitoxin system RelE/ParE family toxin [Kiritimatiellia bacterium]
MGSYKVRFARSAEKDLRRIDKPRIPSVVEAIEALEKDPRPDGCKKLTGSGASYRIRVGDYRVIYTVEDTIRIVEIGRVRHRKDVYR